MIMLTNLREMKFATKEEVELYLINSRGYDAKRKIFYNISSVKEVKINGEVPITHILKTGDVVEITTIVNKQTKGIDGDKTIQIEKKIILGVVSEEIKNIMTEMVEDGKLKELKSFKKSIRYKRFPRIDKIKMLMDNVLTPDFMEELKGTLKELDITILSMSCTGKTIFLETYGINARAKVYALNSENVRKFEITG